MKIRILNVLLLITTTLWGSGVLLFIHEQTEHSPHAVVTAFDDNVSGSVVEYDDDHADCAVCHMLSSMRATTIESANSICRYDSPSQIIYVGDSVLHPAKSNLLPDCRGPPVL